LNKEEKKADFSKLKPKNRKKNNEEE